MKPESARPRATARREPIPAGPVSVRGIARRLRASPVLLAAVLFGLGGVLFALASLLLARALTPAQFGTVTLAIGIVNLGVQLAPLGADGMVNRHAVDFGAPLLRRSLATSSLVSVLLLAATAALYGLPGRVTLPIAFGVLAGGVLRVAASRYQSERRFVRAVSLLNAGNLALLLGALLTLGLGIDSAAFAIAVVAAGHLLCAVLGWAGLLRERSRSEPPFAPFRWGEALSYAGIGAATVVLSQLERLITPLALGLGALGTLAAPAALALAPFRPLQQSAGYTLLPRLRAAVDPAVRRRLIRREALLLATISLPTAALVFWLAPPVLALFVGDKYRADPALLATLLAAGMLRMGLGVAKGIATALCTGAELARLNVLLALALGAGILVTVGIARFGLVALVWGVNATLLADVAIALSMAWPHLRADARPSERPAQLPG